MNKKDVDIHNLSKYRYIYEMYIDRNGTLVYERFPIAYANQHYTYFIRPGAEMLDYVGTSMIWNTFQAMFDNGAVKYNVYKFLKDGGRYHFFIPIGTDEFGAKLKNSLSAQSKYDELVTRKLNLKNRISWEKATIIQQRQSADNTEKVVKQLEVDYAKLCEEIDKAKAELAKTDYAKLCEDINRAKEEFATFDKEDKSK